MSQLSKCAAALAATAALAACLAAFSAQASESGVSFYLLGTGGPGAAVLPPIEGVFLSNTAYYYHGSTDADRQFPIGGAVVAGVKASIAADFATVLWVPSTDFLGGTVGLGGAVALGQPWVDVSAVLVGPRGRQFNLSRKDTDFIFGDPILLAMIGWKRGNTHFELSNMLNVPIGEYREGGLANLAFHRWANDISAAVSWHDPKSGWDVSAKSGFTLNGENHATDYDTGTEWHLEAAIEKQLTPAWSLGVQGYHFAQVTGDSGAGAVLGPFKGRVTAAGATAAYNFKIMGKIPATLRLHGLKEFDARNRMEGHSIFLDFTMPLHVNLPPGAHP